MNLLGVFFCILAVSLFLIVLLKKREYLSVYVLAVVLCLPKVNIITPSIGVTTGIRTEDLVILMFMMVLFIERFKTCREVFGSTIFAIYTLFVISCFLSFIYGYVTKQTFNILFSFFSIIRKIEYFCFIFVGFDFMYHNKSNYRKIFKNLIQAFTVFTAVISIFQYIGIIGVYREGLYQFLGVGVGTFNGPYEVGGLFSIIFIYYIYDYLKNKDRNLIYYMILSILIIVLSKSRSSLLVVFIISLIMILVFSTRERRKIILIAGTASIVLFVILIKCNLFSIFDRFSTFSVKSAINTLKYYSKNVTYEKYKNILLSGETIEKHAYLAGDFSFNVRMFKWVAVLKNFPRNIMFGYGFGSNYVIDGSYVKLLVENGIVGFIIYFAVLLSVLVCKNNRFSKLWIWILMVLFLQSIFIDIFDASKVMEFVWFFIGILLFNVDEKLERVNPDCSWIINEQNDKEKFLYKRRKLK